jgi:hypothetical protein
MWRTSLASLSLVLLCLPAYAQWDRADDPDIQINFIWAVPQGDLANHITRDAVGASIVLGDNLPGVPIFLGTELSFLNHGVDRTLQLFDIEDVPVQALSRTSAYNILGAHLVARVNMPIGPIEPFVDAVAGVRSFKAMTRIESDILVFPGGLSAQTSTSDRSLSYGFGAGVELNLGGLGAGSPPFALSAGFRYMFGNRVTIVPDGGVYLDDNMVRFQTVRTGSDMFMPHLGIRARL